MESVMKITNVSKSIGSKKIIDGISFELKPGEVFGFLGPNGAGKTTTIKMIMGFLSVDSGEITVNGYDHNKQYEKAMAQLGGIVENPEMYQDLSGLVNLQMYAKLHDGVTPERIDEVVRLVGMQDRIREKVKRYSLGMKQRVGLAQAILHHPKILILDEPTNGLDPAGIHELRDILKKLSHEENVAVMVSSHLLSEMQMMCDRVAIIDHGKILDVRLIEELTRDENQVPSFLLSVSDIDAAVKLLEGMPNVALIHQDTDGFEIRVDEKSLQKVLLHLLESGIFITGVNRSKVSLEDAFLRITGGGMHIA